MTTQDVVWAMRVRAIHNSEHDKPMDACLWECRQADEIITLDKWNKIK